MNKNEKFVYFASDFHLGIPDKESSLKREKLIVKWLNNIKPTCKELFIVGDVFDFWFEYKFVIPKHFVRLQAAIANFTDDGIPVHFFHGNHDLWQFGYFEEELGVTVHKKPLTITLDNKRFYIAHGDGLGPGQKKFKFILSIYRNYFFQRLFAFFHPSVGITLANYFSHQSKLKTFDGNFTFYGEKEHLVQHSKTVLQNQHIDYFIYGHRHLPMIYDLDKTSKYINLGDWIGFNTYAVFDGNELHLKTFEQ
ncbi:MAG: UDP-2,3-diacylglucosamine diphosphatase [Bacteroidia bacterium]